MQGRAPSQALPATHAHLIGTLRTPAPKQPFWEPFSPPTVISLHAPSCKSRTETRLSLLALMMGVFWQCVAAHCPVDQPFKSAAGAVEGFNSCIRLCPSGHCRPQGAPLLTILLLIHHGHHLIALIIAVSSVATILCGTAPSVGCWVVMYFNKFQKFSLVAVIWLVGSSMLDILINGSLVVLPRTFPRAL
ncbi:hypothetical protein HDZ31DRAFT_85191 [Schizophyllum fasciatum]